MRELLPSQRGFGEDLQASNVIMPVIDLTAAAEGLSTPQYQQQAIAFGSQTPFSINNATTVVVNSPGFFRIFGLCSWRTSGVGLFSMSDGLSTKVIWQGNADSDDNGYIQYDFIVFLTSGDSLSAQSTTANVFLIGSTRPVADVNGNSINPIGFTPQ